MKELTSKEKAFLDMITAEMLATGITEVTPETMRNALDSIHGRMWSLLTGDKAKKRAVSDAVAKSLFKSFNAA